MEEGHESGDSYERLRQLGDTTSTEAEPEWLRDSIAISESIVQTAQSLQSVDSMAEPPKQESVEEARIILRWLRNLQFSDRDLEEFLDQGTPQTIVSKKQHLQKLAEIFGQHLRYMESVNPAAVKADSAIQNAREALGTIALEVAEHTRALVPDNSASETKLNTLIDALPERAKMRQNQSVEQLLDTLELGMAHVTGKTIERSSYERLAAASKQMDVTTKILKSPDAMDEPAREESIDLAREILRRLKNMTFSDKSLAEFMAHGSPAEKAAFAQQLNEVAGIYKNLLAEASASNAALPKDPAILEAANAIDTFAHSIKLMAAKEMPVSIASSMQISAEAASDPAQWENMQSRTVDRLLKSAGEALEKAVAEVVQQQEQDRAEEQGQEAAAEQAAQHAAHEKSKKKRHKGDSKPRSSGGKSGKKSRKQHHDHTADDYVLKQGRFSVDAKAARTDNAPAAAPSGKPSSKAPDGKGKKSGGMPGMAGLKEADLQAIQKLGNSLRDIGNQLKGIGGTIATVTTVEKITPDNKTMVQQIKDREQQKPQTPTKGGQGPRV